MASSWRSVMAWRGSPGPAHSGTAAGASRSRRPSPTRRPTTACSTDLAIDQLSKGVSAVTGVGVPVEMLERPPVALGDDRTTVHDEHGEGVGERALVVEDLVEQRGRRRRRPAAVLRATPRWAMGRRRAGRGARRGRSQR